KTIRSWYKFQQKPNTNNLKEDTEFFQQYQEIEKEYDTFSQNTPYQIYPAAVTTSKLISTKQIMESLQQIPSKQCVSREMDFDIMGELVIQEEKAENSTATLTLNLPKRDNNFSEGNKSMTSTQSINEQIELQFITNPPPVVVRENVSSPLTEQGQNTPARGDMDDTTMKAQIEVSNNCL
ncbi:514_t:CDS:1, partial [Cetraspora pellucida]